MLAQILADSAQSEKVLIWTLILSSVGSLIASVIGLAKYLIDRKSDQDKQARADAQVIALREQDRLDAKAKAEIILLEGAKREKRLAQKIDENTEVSKAAFKEANGIKAEVAATKKEIADAVKVIAESSAAK